MALVVVNAHPLVAVPINGGLPTSPRPIPAPVPPPPPPTQQPAPAPAPGSGGPPPPTPPPPTPTPPPPAGGTSTYPKSLTVPITNPFSTPITLTMTLVQPGNIYTATTDCPGTLQPGQTCNLVITATRQPAPTDAAQVQVAYNGPGSPAVFCVDGGAGGGSGGGTGGSGGISAAI